MEITESHLSTVLQEAFTCFLAFLAHTQKLREAKLPRQGKGVETTTDLSAEKHYESRAAATEICLKYTGKIARSVRRWNKYQDHGSDDEVIVEAEVVSFGASLPDGYESSFLDTLSGAWISPTTPFSAGPSGSNIEDSRHILRYQDTSQSRHRRRRRRREVIGICDESANGRNSDINPPRASISIHPNISISPLVSSIDRDHSTLTSLGSGTVPKLCTSSSISSICNENDDVTLEVATNFYLRETRDMADKKYAETIQIQEKEQRKEAERQMVEAKRLSDEWAREERSRRKAQERYAKKLEREEQERAENIKKDSELAQKAAQKAQEHWELAAIARETEAMRLEERKRREQAEAERIAEEERKAKIQRDKAWAAKIKERNRLITEEKKRKEAENIAKWERKQKEKERKARLPKKTDCVSCMEAGFEKDMIVLSCNHAYCGDCVKGAFKSAYKSRSPFKCCGSVIPSSVTRNLSTSFVGKYHLMVLELNTKRPKFCSSSRCHKFIPPAEIHGPTAICPYCKTKTCVACGRNEHSGVCAEDKEGKAVEALAQQKGWKQCPKCSQILERTEGCLHMTCRCKAEWCYSCLRDWSICRSTCGRVTPWGTEMGTGIGMAEGTRPTGRIGLIPVVAAAVLMSLFDD